MKNYKKYVENIRKELKQYIIKNNIKSLVLGVSGGADSALTAILASSICNELKIPLIGRSITIESNKQNEIDRAKSTGLIYCNDFEEIDLTDLYKITTVNYLHLGDAKVDPKSKEIKIRKGNVKARLRMIYLYNLASENSGMVLSTDNFSEYLLGFWTLHGDVGDYGMIQELWKTEIYEMLEYLRDNEAKSENEAYLIESIINADATDGLGITNTDLDQLLPGWEGSSKDGYAEVDILLKYAYHNIYELKRFDQMDENMVYTSNPVLERVIATRFKRENPVNIPRKNIVK